MRTLIFCALVGISLLLTPASHAQETITYKFGVVPQFEPRKLASIWVPILAELSKRSGYNIQMSGASTIPKFEADFENGLFDFAYMNPYHSLIAFKQQGYMPIVKDGSRQLFGVLVVRKDSPITSPSELMGAKIAFPSPNALGASLLLRSELIQDFNLDFTPVYAQTHTSSYLNVLLGETQAAGGVMSTLNKQKDDIKNNLKVIHKTRSVAPHPIVAHPRVPSDVTAKVKSVLFEMYQEDKWKEAFKKIPINQLSEASRKDYKNMEDWQLDKFYIYPNSQ